MMARKQTARTPATSSVLWRGGSVVVLLVMALAASNVEARGAKVLDPLTGQEWAPGALWAKVNVGTGEVVANSAHFKVVGDELRFDTLADYRCGSGEQVHKVQLSTSPVGFVDGRQVGQFNGVHRGNSLLKEKYFGLKFASIDELVADCRSGKTSRDLFIQQRFTCFDDGLLIDSTEGVKGGKRLTMRLECVDEKPATVKVDVKLSCPPGYWVGGTREREKVIRMDARFIVDLSNRTCVPEGTDPGQKACPFISTRVTPAGGWIDQGTILTYLQGKEMEQGHVTELGAFSGSVLIRELDPETSFIDSMRVVLYHQDGSKEVLLPTIGELQARDGSYLVTNQGDEVEVRFTPSTRQGFVRAEVISHGYYELY
jgi:hypothetical protein